MPAIKSGPPEGKGCRYVLFHRTLDPVQAFRRKLYGEAVEARSVEWDGRLRQVIFCDRWSTRDYLWRRGWVDITVEWHVARGTEIEPESNDPLRGAMIRAYGEQRPPVPAPDLSEDAVQLLTMIAGSPDPVSSSDAADALDLTERRMRAARAELRACGLIDQIGTPARWTATDSGRAILAGVAA